MAPYGFLPDAVGTVAGSAFSRLLSANAISKEATADTSLPQQQCSHALNADALGAVQIWGRSTAVSRKLPQPRPHQRPQAVRQHSQPQSDHRDAWDRAAIAFTKGKTLPASTPGPTASNTCALSGGHVLSASSHQQRTSWRLGGGCPEGCQQHAPARKANDAVSTGFFCGMMTQAYGASSAFSPAQARIEAPRPERVEQQTGNCETAESAEKRVPGCEGGPACAQRVCRLPARPAAAVVRRQIDVAQRTSPGRRPAQNRIRYIIQTYNTFWKNNPPVGASWPHTSRRLRPGWFTWFHMRLPGRVARMRAHSGAHGGILIVARVLQRECHGLGAAMRRKMPDSCASAT